MRRASLVGVLLVVTVTSLAAATWMLGGRGAADPAPETARVLLRDLSTTVLATGVVQPQLGAEVKVGSRISGTIESLRANVGDKVQRGQVIAELEKQDLLEALARSRADVEVARARLADAEARRRLAESDLERQSGLFERDLSSREALDTAVSSAEVARAAHQLASAQLEASLASLREAEVRLSYATIRAPLSGVVASVSTQEGETVAAGLSAPTFVTIIDLERLQVDAFVDEVDIGRVAVGQEATFTVDSFPDVDFEGVVRAIHPEAVIQDNVVNYDVVIGILSSYEGRLRPDMTANVSIVESELPAVLAIPPRALRRLEGETVVDVLHDSGRVETRRVQTGRRESSWIEVVEGLSEGEILVLDVPEEEGRR